MTELLPDTRRVELFIGLLGPPLVRVGTGSETHDVGGARQRRLLAMLALHPGVVLSVERLAEAVWPDGDEPADPRKTLHSYIYRLRQVLGPGDRLESVHGGYRLADDHLVVDSHEFERLVSEATRDDASWQSVVDTTERALALWRGPPLDEFAHEDWARPDAVRLNQRWAVAVERRCEALLGLGRHADSLGALTVLIERHPLRERPRALQMLALYHDGRQAEALRTYQEFRRFMIDEAGVDPSVELVELDRAIATGTVAAASKAPTRQVKSYEIHESIGVGAFAEVYRGTQTGLGRDVAIKAIRAELANRPEFIRAFEAEAAMVARLEHPHIVPLYDFWREPDRAYLVMRWITGGSLESRLDAGPLSFAEVTTLAAQIGAALSVAHRSGVVHRDVKPANILVDDDGNAYLSDFGIAQGQSDREGRLAALSEGSPAYAAPEQLRREPVGAPTDVHGLAVTVYEALAGHMPFPDAVTRAELLRHQLNDPLPPLRTERPGLPTGVDVVLARATAKSPDRRYQTAQAFVEALTDAFESSGVSDLTVESAKRLTAVARAAQNPYKGLRAFDEGDAREFYGRSRLIDELLEAVDVGGAEPRLVSLVGPSGSGKSSVVRAGLVPALRSGSVPGSADWFITTMAPGPHPFRSLAEALLRVAVDPPESLVDELMDGPRGIQRGARRVLPGGTGTVLLVIDQFEELFTLCDDEDLRCRFLESLTEAVTDPSSSLRVVSTLRADFFDRPLRYPGLADIFKRRSITVTPLAADELEAAIVDPAERVGVEIEPGLVSEIMADVASQPGALPLLQYALTELFDQRVAGVMTIEGYRTMGGLAGALATTADELWRSGDGPQRGATRRLFGRLVTLGDGVEDTRRVAAAAELASDPATQSALDCYASARLLTFDRDLSSRLPTVEVAHEALLREWPRLREWLDEDREWMRTLRTITAASAVWHDGGRDASDLWRGARLESARDFTEDYALELNEAERAFLEASLAAHDEQVARTVQTNRRLRRLVLAVSVVALLAVVAGSAAVFQWNEASEQRTAAEDLAEEAAELRDQALADADELQLERTRALNALRAEGRARDEAEAALREVQVAQLVQQSELAEDPVVATLLAVEAAALDPVPATTRALASALTSDGGWLASLNDTGYVFDAGQQPWFVTLEADAVAVRDRADFSVLRRIEVAGSFDELLPQVSSEGTRIVLLTEDRRLQVVDLITGATGTPHEVVALSTRLDASVTPMWTRDDRYIVVGVEDGLAVLRVDGLEVFEESRHQLSATSVPGWLDADPTADRFSAAVGSTIVTFDASKLDRGVLAEVSRIEMGPPLPGQGLFSYTPDGSIVTAWGAGIWRIADTGRTQIDTDVDLGIPLQARPLADGVLFVAGFSASVIVDPNTGDVLVPPLELPGIQYEAVSLLGGEAVAVVSLGVGGLAPRVDVVSLSGAAPLLDALPALPGNGVAFWKYRDGYLSDFERGRLWELDDDRWRSIDLRTRDDADCGTSPCKVGFRDTVEGMVAWAEQAPGRWTVHRLPGGERIGAEIATPDSGAWGSTTADLRHFIVWADGAARPFDLSTGDALQPIDHGGATEWVADDPSLPGVGFINASDGTTLVFDPETLDAAGAAIETCPLQDVRSDGTLALVMCETGVELRTWPDLVAVKRFSATETGAFSGAFRGDGGHFVAFGTTGLQLWDVGTGDALTPPITGQVDLRPGAALTVTRAGGRMFVFNDDVSSWAGVACRAAGRNLTSEEWAEYMPADLEYAPSCG